MPAYRDEIVAAEDEGINTHYLAAPSKVVGSVGKVTGLECIRTELGETDASGRRRPMPVAGSEFVIPADSIIAAIGELPDLSFLNAVNVSLTPGKTVQVSLNSMVTNLKGIFAGGDVVSGPATVIEAIAAGNKAAVAIDNHLRGQDLDAEEIVPRVIGIEDIEVERFRNREREKMPTIVSKQRINGFEEVEVGFTELQALSEADRCLQCGLFPNKNR